MSKHLGARARDATAYHGRGTESPQHFLSHCRHHQIDFSHLLTAYVLICSQYPCSTAQNIAKQLHAAGTPSIPTFEDVFFTMFSRPTGGASAMPNSMEVVNRRRRAVYSAAQVCLQCPKDPFHVTGPPLTPASTMDADIRFPVARHRHLPAQPVGFRTQLGRDHSFAHQR